MSTANPEVWIGDLYGKQVETLVDGGERRFAVRFTEPGPGAEWAFENNITALAIIAEHGLPGPRLLSVDRERQAFTISDAGETVENLLHADPSQTAELVGRATRTLFAFAAANAEERQGEAPRPLLVANRLAASVPDRYQTQIDRLYFAIKARVVPIEQKSYQYGFANTDCHLRNFTVKDGEMGMIDFDHFHTHHDPVYLAAFLHYTLGFADEQGRVIAQFVVASDAVLANVDWTQEDAARRFAAARASLSLASLCDALGLGRSVVEEMPPAEVLGFCGAEIKDALKADWPERGHEAQERLAARPVLASGLDSPTGSIAPAHSLEL
jgi:hypothetical protein